MFKNLIKTSLILTLTFQGCSSLRVHQFAARSDRPLSSENFFDIINRQIKFEKIEDVSSFQIDGFPYLRTNRFLSAFKNQDLTSEQFNTWIDHMFKLQLETKEKELKNLSQESLALISSQLKKNFTHEELIQKSENHAKNLLIQDQKQTDFHDKIKLAIKAPSEYSAIKRIIGLYPLFYLPVKNATLRAYDKFKQWHQQPFENYSPLGNLRVFGIKKTALPAHFFHSSTTYDTLGVPKMDLPNQYQLALSFAPYIFQDTVDTYDHFGKIIWQNKKVTVDTTKPTVYYYITHTFVNEKPVLQLNYSIWFIGRYGANAPWLERGALDGLTFRITLDQNGQPLLLDVINNCACYHLLIPKKEAITRIKDPVSGIQPLIARWLPKQYPENPLKLLLTTGWHQLQRIDAENPPEEFISYNLLPYSDLESLSHTDGYRENVFNNHGIMKNSSRIEPLFFFPSGINKVGYMRQREHHPIKLIGQAHFTDPNLLEDLFEFKK
ncbi:MAG: hypothetical protein KC733_02590 [Candidatus Omnitrophica bacterium]|nr:hypothetical protein [Candidatus Omnitrophota bacterium]